MISLLAQALRTSRLHGAGDAAYHGKALLVERTTITTRLPVNAALYAPAPPHTGRRGRPRLKGNRLGHPADLAANADWRPVTLTRYGHTDTVEIALCDTIWYGAFGNTEGRTVLVRDPAGDRVLAIFAADTDSDAQTIVERYTHRWQIETAIAAGKQLLGMRPARNRLRRAVERTVPLGFCVSASSSSGTRCTDTTETTSRHAARSSPGTHRKTSPPSKTCSPNSADPYRIPNYGRCRSLSPIHTRIPGLENWPAPQPPHNCETQARNTVEEFLDVQVEHPVGFPAALPAYAHRVQRRAARPVTIGVVVEDRLDPRLELLGHHRLRHPVGDGRYA